jgi:DNA-binding Lrp family transcriptional regulator
MTTMMERAMKSHTEDEAILFLLGEHGSATIEDLTHRLDMSWERVFSTVDRLSRSGAIRLTRVGVEYYVEKVGNA